MEVLKMQEKKVEKTRKCSSLQENEQVVFKVDPYHNNEKRVFDGSVIYVSPDRKQVCVCYLEGYKSRTDDIPYEDMLAVYDKEGNYMKFDNISGPSRKLVAE